MPPATLIASLHEHVIPAEERRKSITTVLKEVREDDQAAHQVELHNGHGNKVQDGDHHGNNHIGNADHLKNGHSNKDVLHKKEHINVAFEPDSKHEVNTEDDTRL